MHILGPCPRALLDQHSGDGAQAVLVILLLKSEGPWHGVKGWDPRISLPVFKSSRVTLDQGIFFGLSFLICQMGILQPTSENGCDEWIRL